MAISSIIKKIVLPHVQKKVDGRDTGSSRRAFILAANGGAIGIGRPFQASRCKRFNKRRQLS
jgi:solute carrier family 6 (neurotransmitter transporter, GABA) member 1